DVAQQVTALHPVVDTAENGGDDLPPVVPVVAGQSPQVGKESGAAFAVRPRGLILVDEGKQLVPGDALRVGRPVSPTVGWLDGRAELLARQLGLLRSLKLEVVEE